MEKSLFSLKKFSPSWIQVLIPIVVLLLIAGATLAFYAFRTADEEPSTHQQISSLAPLRISLPADLDHQSVETLAVLPQNFTYSSTWSGDNWSLQPKTPLTIGESIVITVPRTTLRSDGTPLGKDLTFTFKILGSPKVSAVLPIDQSAQVPLDAELSVIFDRPMVPLTQVQGSPSQKLFSSWLVTVDPPVQGQWKWMGSTTATLKPSKKLLRATRYTVTVPTTIQTLSGENLEKEHSWSFETERPRVLGITPSTGDQSSGPTSELSVEFNQLVDLTAIRSSISLVDETSVVVKGNRKTKTDSGSELAIKSLHYATTKVDGVTKTNPARVIIVPAEPLQFHHGYALTVKQGLKGKEGDLGTLESAVSHFQTVGEFTVLSAEYKNSSIQVRFSSPVDEAQLQKGLLFSPTIDVTKDVMNTYPNYSDTSVNLLDIYRNLKPSTTYTLTVSPSMIDVYGQKLSKPFSYVFTTPALEPDIFIHPRYSGFSIFEKGKTPTYYLNSLNVSSIDVKLAQLDFSAFKKFVTERGMSYYNTSALDLHEYASDVREWHLKPKSKKNLWESKTFDLHKMYGDLKPGLYAVTMNAPEYKASGGQESRVFAVTNLGVTLKYSGDRALVWVADVQTGKPVSSAKVSFRALKTDAVVTGTTDASGIVDTAVAFKDFVTGSDYYPQFYVTVEKDDDFTFLGSDWNDGFQPYNFDGVSQDFRYASSAPYRLHASIYTDRPLYRAGDKVHFKGITRFLDWNGKFSIPSRSSRTVDVKIVDAEQNEVYRKTVPLTEFGSFDGSFLTAKEASLGNYFIHATLLPQGDSSPDTMYGEFSVLAYRKPEYKVQITPEKSEYVSGEKFKAEISGAYYFGAPMQKASVEWRTILQDYFFNKYTESWYSFSVREGSCWWEFECQREQNLMTSGKGVLDASGKMSVSLPLSLDDKKVSQGLAIEADITDENNQVVSGHANVLVHKANVYVGIRSDEFGVQSGSETAVSVIALTPDGTPIEGKTIEVTLFSRAYNVVREKGVDGEYYYKDSYEDTKIFTKSVRTDDAGKAVQKLLLAKGGEYIVIASAKDSEGRETKAGWSVYAWSGDYYNWPRTNNDRMQMIADKPLYKPGQTAHIIIKSPFQGEGVRALVTVERENILSKKIIDVKKNAESIDVPITKDMIPTAYVSVTVLKPRIGETFNEHGLDTGAPAFKIGYVKLNIDTSSKAVKMTITTDKKRYQPRETVTARIETVDADGNPVPTELSLAVVDRSLLDLVAFKNPDLVGYFYHERGLGVITANMLTYLMERFKPGSKGGGGGGDSQTETTRANLLDTAYWNPRVVTDANGIATVTFTLPDNLTTWHLLGIGSTKGNLFGVQSMEVIETKNVIVRPVRPRFAISGDKITLGAIVHNYLETEKTFTVILEGNGFSSEGSAEQSITLKPDQSEKLNFPIAVGDTDSLTLKFSAVTEGGRDAIEEKIPVYRFGDNQSNALSGVTENTAVEAIDVPSKADAPLGSLTVSVSPSLAVYLPKSLSFLSKFPYGCSEQTTSALIPSVALKQLQGFEQFKVVDDTELENNIQVGLQKLQSFQRSDGGFGYWENSDTSYPFLTAYIAYSLRIARDAGYHVDPVMIDRAVAYLRSSTRNISPKSEQLRSPTFLYILYVLSEFNETDKALLLSSAKNRIDLPLVSKAYLAMALQKAGQTAKAKEITDEFLSYAREDDRVVRFHDSASNSYFETMNTDAVTTAIVARAFFRINPDSVLLPKIIRGMLAMRHDGHWDTTQSTAQSVLTLVEFLKSTKELDYDFESTVQVATTKASTNSFTSPALLKKDVSIALSTLPRSTVVPINISKKGKGRLYYDAVLSYFYSPKTIEPADEGIGIVRETLPMNPADASMKVGSTHKVRLTITVPVTRYFVAVEGMLPAGFEAIDLKYATSQKNLYEQVVNNGGETWQDYYRNQTWRFTHIEFRDDRIFLFADELPPGVYTYEYLVRATTPGTFRERPARVWEMYYPETFGQSSGGPITIKE